MRDLLYIGTVTTALFAVASAVVCPLTFEYSKKYHQCVRPTSVATCKSFKKSYHSGEVCFVPPNNHYPSDVSFCQDPFQECDNDLGHCCWSVSSNDCARYEAYFANGQCIVPVSYDKGVKNICPEGFGWTPKMGYCTRLLRLTKFCSSYREFKIIDAKCCVPAKNVTLTTPPEKPCPKRFEDVDGVCEGTLRNKRCTGGVRIGGKCYSSPNPTKGSGSTSEESPSTTEDPSSASEDPSSSSSDEPSTSSPRRRHRTRKTRKPKGVTEKPTKGSGSASESQKESNSHNQCPVGFLATKHGCFGPYTDNCHNHKGINRDGLCVITFPTCPQNFEPNNGQCVGELSKNKCKDAKGVFSASQKLCVVAPQDGHPDCPPAFVWDAGLCVACKLSEKQCESGGGTYDNGYCYVVPHSKTHECPAKSTLIHGLCASVGTTKCECDAAKGQYDATTSSCLFDAKKIKIQEAECQTGFDFDPELKLCRKDVDNFDCTLLEGDYIGGACLIEPNKPSHLCHEDFLYDRAEKVCKSADASRILCRHLRGKYEHGICTAAANHTDSGDSQIGTTKKPVPELTCPSGTVLSGKDGKCSGRLNIFKCFFIGGKYASGLCVVDAKKSEGLITTMAPAPKDESTTKDISHELICPPGTVLSKNTGKCYGRLNNFKCSHIGGKMIASLCVVEPKKADSFKTTPKPKPFEDASTTPEDLTHVLICPSGTVLSKTTRKCYGRLNNFKCSQIGGKLIVRMCVVEPKKADSIKPTTAPVPEDVSTTVEDLFKVLFCPSGMILSKSTGKCYGRLNNFKCSRVGGKLIARLCVVDAKRADSSKTTPKPKPFEDASTTPEDLSKVLFCPSGTVLSKTTGKCYGRLNYFKCARIGGKFIAKLCIVDAQKVTKHVATTTEPSFTKPADTLTTDDKIVVSICPTGTELSPKDGKCYGKLDLYQCFWVGGKMVSGVCVVDLEGNEGDPTEEPLASTKGPVPEVSCPEGTVLSTETGKCRGRLSFGKCRQLGGRIINGLCNVEPIKKPEPPTEPETSTKGVTHELFCPEGTVLFKETGKCHGRMSFVKCMQLGGKYVFRVCVVEPVKKQGGVTTEPEPTDEVSTTTEGFDHKVFCPEGTVLSEETGKCRGRLSSGKCRQLGGRIVNRLCNVEPVKKQETTKKPEISTKSPVPELVCPEGTLLSKETGKCRGRLSFGKCHQLGGKIINRVCVVEPIKKSEPTKEPEPTVEVSTTTENFVHQLFCPEGTVLSKETGKCRGKMSHSKCRQLGGRRVAGVCIVAAKKPTTPYAPTAEPSDPPTTFEDPPTTTEKFDDIKFCPKGTVLSQKTGKCYGKLGPSKCNLLGGKIIGRLCIVLPKTVNPVTTEEPEATTEEPEATTELVTEPTTREPPKPLVVFPVNFDSDVEFYTKEPKVIVCRSDAPANTRTERCEKSTTAAQCTKLKGLYYAKIGLCSIAPHVQRVPLCYDDLDYYNGVHFCGLDYSKDECESRGYAFYKNRCIYAPIKKLLSCPAGSTLSKVQGEQELNKCIHKLPRKHCEKNGFKYEKRQCFSYAEPCPAGYTYDNSYESCKKPNASKASCKLDKGILYAGACFVPPLVE